MPSNDLGYIKNTNKSSIWLWLGVAAFWIIFDQLTKYLVISNYKLHQGTTITSFFNIFYARNYGAAFSFLSDVGGWQRWFFTFIGIVVSGFIIWMMKKNPTKKIFCFALACILGGALGNVLDRLQHGFVVDMLDFHWPFLQVLFHGGHFPTFNIADVAINIGVICLIYDEIRRLRKS